MIGSRLTVLLRKRLVDLFLAGVGISDEPPTVPGMEFAVPVNRMHFTAPANRMHFAVSENRMHFVVSEQD